MRDLAAYIGLVDEKDGAKVEVLSTSDDFHLDNIVRQVERALRRRGMIGDIEVGPIRPMAEHEEFPGGGISRVYVLKAKMAGGFSAPAPGVLEQEISFLSMIPERCLAVKWDGEMLVSTRAAAAKGADGRLAEPPGPSLFSTDLGKEKNAIPSKDAQAMVGTKRIDSLLSQFEKERKVRDKAHKNYEKEPRSRPAVDQGLPWIIGEAKGDEDVEDTLARAIRDTLVLAKGDGRSNPKFTAWAQAWLGGNRSERAVTRLLDEMIEELGDSASTMKKAMEQWHNLRMISCLLAVKRKNIELAKMIIDRNEDTYELGKMIAKEPKNESWIDRMHNEINDVRIDEWEDAIYQHIEKMTAEQLIETCLRGMTEVDHSDPTFDRFASRWIAGDRMTIPAFPSTPSEGFAEAARMGYVAAKKYKSALMNNRKDGGIPKNLVEEEVMVMIEFLVTHKVDLGRIAEQVLQIKEGFFKDAADKVVRTAKDVGRRVQGKITQKAFDLLKTQLLNRMRAYLFEVEKIFEATTGKKDRAVHAAAMDLIEEIEAGIEEIESTAFTDIVIDNIGEKELRSEVEDSISEVGDKVRALAARAPRTAAVSK